MIKLVITLTKNTDSAVRVEDDAKLENHTFVIVPSNIQPLLGKFAEIPTMNTKRLKLLIYTTLDYTRIGRMKFCTLTIVVFREDRPTEPSK